jgi:hypothetical protein
MALTARNRCRHCCAKYAQEMGLCRGCQQRRLDNLPPLNPDPARAPVVDDSGVRAVSRRAWKRRRGPRLPTGGDRP